MFEFLYRGVTLPVWLRFCSRGLQKALQMAGYSYLTEGNLGNFLLKPWTIGILALTGAVGIMLLILEVAGLITAFQGSAHHRRLTPLHIFWGGIQKSARQSWKRNWRLGLIIFGQYLLTELLFVIWGLVRIRPVSFVAQELSKKPWIVVLLAAALLFLAVILVPLSYTAFGCMVEQRDYKESVSRSRSMVHGKCLALLGAVFTATLFSLLVTVAAYAAAVFAAAVFVAAFTEKNLAMAVLLSVEDRLELVFLFLGSTLTSTFCYGALSACYYRYGSRRFHEESWDLSYPAKGTAGRRTMAAVWCTVFAIGLLYIFDLVQSGFAFTSGILAETQITAHRGSSRSAPENTMSAIYLAMEELADCVELDVQLSADGVAVLGHDATLKRVAGVNRPISALNLEQLKRLDVGSWFSEEYAGEQIPTLEEVLEACRGKIFLNIEVKNVGKGSELPLQVAKLVLDSGMEEQCVITSVSLNYLKEIKAFAPQLRTGYIISAAYGDFYSNEAVDFISVRSGFINQRLVENVHAQGKGVHAWTVNAKSEIERLVMLGVDGIITDRPVLAREIVYREAATETLLEYLRLVFR